MPSENGKNECREAGDGVLDPIETAKAYGIDVSMLVDNLGRSVTERLRRHEIARRTAQMLRRAKPL